MAVNAKAVIDIEVNDQAFKAFTTAFDKFQKVLGRTPAAWKEMSSEQRAMAQIFQQGTAALMAQNELMRKGAAFAKDVSVHSESSFKHWRDIAGKAKEMGQHVLGITGDLMKWGGIAAGIITGGGIASMFGLDRLAQWVRGGSISGSRVDMKSGELKAVKGIFGDPYGIDVEGLAKTATTAANNTTSDEYRVLVSMLGLNPEKLRGTGKVTAIMEAIRKMRAAGWTPEQMAQQSGGVLDAGLVRLTTNIPEDEFRKGLHDVPDEARRLEIPKATEQAWNNFLKQLDMAAEELKGILVVGLQPILGMITENSQKWLDNLREFMKPDGEFQEFLKKVPPIVKEVGDTLVAAFQTARSLLIYFGQMKGTPEEQAKARHDQVMSGMIPADQMTAAENTERNAAVEKARSDFIESIKQGVWSAFKSITTGAGNAPQGGFQDGTPMVPKTGTYTLHRGEMVLPEADADLLRHSSMEDWKRAITGIESGGNYEILGKLLASGDQAVGKYQVMRSNIASWTQQALGHSMTAQQFRMDKQAQERVFETIFGQYVSRFGNPLDAAAAWFSGQPITGNRAGPDALGTTVPSYIKQFLAGLGASGGGMRPSIDINDNTGGNVALALSGQPATLGPLPPFAV